VADDQRHATPEEDHGERDQGVQGAILLDRKEADYGQAIDEIEDVPQLGPD